MDAAERARRDEIVTAGAGRRVVIAGPGAGKTELLVSRVRHLLDGGARPREVLTLVFNRRAAAELRQRLATALPDRGFVELRIATFHSFALAVTDRFWARTGLAGRPALLPADEQRATVRALLAADPDPDGWHVPATVRTSRSFGQAVADAVLRAQEQMLAPGDLAARDGAAGSFLARYLDATTAGARLDHAGVLAVAAGLVADDDVRAALGVRHLLVDEYQDANLAQAALVGTLARNCDSVVVVGDPAQAIYGFRGASVALLDAAPAELHGERLELTHGFRCPQPVLDAAGSLLAADPALPPRAPLTGAGDPTGGVAAAAFSHRGDELAWIADHVRELGRTTAWGDIAILTRSLRTLRAPLTAALSRAGIPHHVAGGPRSTVRNPWVERLLDLLQVVDDADPTTGLLLLEAAALSPLVAGDPFHVREAFRHARRAADPESALQTWADDAAGEGDPAAATRAAVGRLLTAVRSARRAAAGGDVAAVAWVLWSRLPAADRLAAAAGDPGACPPADVEGGRAAGIWHDSLAHFVERNPGAGVADYLSTLDPDDPGELWHAERADASPAVAVLTVHQAKGLEFDHVVVPAVEDGRFPVDARSRGLLDRLGLAAPTTGDEERRLLYVALTRARRTVTLTCTVGTEEQADATPSRFFADLADHLADPGDLHVGVPTDPVLGDLGAVSAVSHARRRWGTVLRAAPHGPDAAVAASGLAALGAPLPWVGEAPLPADRALRDRPWALSASAIELYLGCGRRFLFDRVLRLAPFEESPASAFGNAVHEAVARWLQEQEAPDEELLRIRLHEEFDATAAPAMPNGLQRRAFQRRLDPVAANVARTLLPDMGTPVLVEADLAVERPDGHRILARPDVVARIADGLEVVDWKTSRKPPPKVQEHAQLAVYHHVVSETQGEPVTRLRLGLVVPGTWSEQTVEPDHVRWTGDIVQRAVTGIAAEDFEVGEAPSCRYCAHLVLCDAHQRGLEPPW